MENSTDLLTEIKQEMTKEKVVNLIRNYGKYIISSIIIILIAFSLYIYLNNRNINKQKLFAEEYQNLFLQAPISLAQQGVIEKYIEKTDSTTFEYLASFHYANLLSNNSQANKAIEMLIKLADQNSLPEMANLSLVLASEIAIKAKAKNYNHTLITLLTKRTEKNNNKVPQFYTMQLMLVTLLIEEGNISKAKEILKTIDDNNIPQNIKLLKNMLSNTIFTKKYE